MLAWGVSTYFPGVPKLSPRCTAPSRKGPSRGRDGEDWRIEASRAPQRVHCFQLMALIIIIFHLP